MWDDICERKDESKDDSEREEPKNDKDLVIWNSKDNKAYALIVVSVDEDVSKHIISRKMLF